MPCLLDFSNEILRCIIDSVDPADLEHFSACCKSIQTLAKSAMKRHKMRKAHYGELKFGDIGKLRGWVPLAFLCKTISDPSRRYYPTSIQIGKFSKNRFYDKALMREYCDQIVATISDRRYIAVDEEETWRVAILNGGIGATLGFILTLLPNIQSIAVFKDPKGLFSSMIEHISHSYALGEAGGQQALGKLSRVTVNAIDQEHGIMGPPDKDMRLLRQLSVIPSVNSLCGKL